MDDVSQPPPQGPLYCAATAMKFTTTPVVFPQAVVPSMSRHSSVNPVDDALATVGTQWSPDKRPARSRTPSVMITLVPGGNAGLNVTPTEVPEEIVATPAR
jgi:hypothetical protein